jgi:UDP-N-acetylmuramoylalanine--D-glutamate ligase
MMDFKNKKISVIGLGKTGLSAAGLLVNLGADVFVSEIKSQNEVSGEISRLDRRVGYETGQHSGRLLDAELVIKSPGVKSDLPVLIECARKDIPVWSELELSSRLITPEILVAITGTNGKTTTTTLVSNIFRKAGFNVITAGNIDKPLSSFVSKIDKSTAVILEVSSYQLENIDLFKPHISCILNITPDHLEHHETMQKYIEAKKRIFGNQSETDYCILNEDNDMCRKLTKDCPSRVVYFSSEPSSFVSSDRPTGSKTGGGVYYDGKSFVLNLSSVVGRIVPVLKIPGKHNIENVLASISISALCNIAPAVIERAISEFEGVEHRLEFVRELGGVKYVNDSKSTNVDSSIVALRSFDGRLLLIMGGRDKGAPYIPLYELVKDRVKTLYLVGEAANKIKHDLSGATEIIDCKDLETAVKRAYKMSSSGDIVLLSPGCSSFDQFRNFEHRGNTYKKIVQNLVLGTPH